VPAPLVDVERLDALHDTLADRVKVDIPYQLKKVRFLLDDN
jgi:hypothetical protein